jgi:hypothetical protein
MICESTVMRKGKRPHRPGRTLGIMLHAGQLAAERSRIRLRVFLVDCLRVFLVDWLAVMGRPSLIICTWPRSVPVRGSSEGW